MLGGVREVAESCMDSVNLELVAVYRNRIHPTKPELAARRIESIGYQVGLQLAERYTKDCPRFGDHLEAVKFICKDFWAEVFKKQIDNLKTNHRVNQMREKTQQAAEPRTLSSKHYQSTVHDGVADAWRGVAGGFCTAGQPVQMAHTSFC